MNVTDFEPPDYCELSAIPLMWNRQVDLEAKYAEIESRNGFAHDEEGSIDLHRVQDNMKHAAWCITEELCEMAEAYHKGGNNVHVYEEYADAMAFTLMLMIQASSHTSIRDYINRHILSTQLKIIHQNSYMGVDQTIDTHIIRVVYSLGMTMHKLKSKRWKATPVETDIQEFNNELISVWNNMLSLWLYIDIVICGNNQSYTYDAIAEKLFNYYFRKSEVNKFRQRSNY